MNIALSLAVLVAVEAQDVSVSPPPSPPAQSSSAASSSSPPAAPAVPAEATAPDSEIFARAVEALRFADHLFLDGDWYRAITEYRRHLYLVKGRGAEAERAAVAIGEALARGEQWDAAGRQLDGVAQRAARLELRHEALYAAGQAYLADGRPELAKPRFRLVVEDNATEPRLRARSKWLLAWGHFDAGELELARRYFQELADAKQEHAAEAATIVQALDAEGSLPIKDPLLAGILSLVPGLGHAYLGQWGVASTSFVWNSLFIFAAVSAWLSGDWAVAVVLSVFELGWYSGGIFGAVAGAYRHNRDAVRNWRDEILANSGTTRLLPEMHEVEGAPPGTLVRFSGKF